MIDFRVLVKAGVHFGHQSSRWNPRMAPYIWGTKNNVHLINVAKTAAQLEKASKELEKIVAEGKTVLWIGTKKAAQQIVTNAAQSVHMPFVTHRWIGGTLTNFPQVKKSVTRYLHFQDVVTKADTAQHTKKELNSFQKIVGRLHKNIGGIVDLTWPVGAIVVVDVKKEASAVKEAASVGIPVFAIVDTNCDPLLVNFVIPGNDDSAHSIEALIKPLAEAALRGKEVADAKRQEEAKEYELLREKRRAARVEQAEGNEALVALLEQEEEEETEEGKKSGKKTFAPRREGGSTRPSGHGSNNRAAGQKRTFSKSAFATTSDSSSAPQGPRREFDPNAPRPPRREFDPNAPRKPFDPNAPRPPRREFDPNAPRRPYDPNAPRPPRREYDPNAPRKPFDPNAPRPPRREFDPNAPRRPYDPNAPRPPRREYSSSSSTGEKKQETPAATPDTTTKE